MRVSPHRGAQGVGSTSGEIPTPSGGLGQPSAPVTFPPGAAPWAACDKGDPPTLCCMPWPSGCVASTLLRRNWGWEPWCKPAGPVTVTGRVRCSDDSSDLDGPSRAGPGLTVPAFLPTPPTGPSRAHVALWEHFPAVFFFLTFISSNSWLLQPYGVLPKAAAQGMWHFDVSNFILTRIDAELGESGGCQCLPAGWPHVGPEICAHLQGCPCLLWPPPPGLCVPLSCPPPGPSLCLSLSLGEKQTFRLCYLARSCSASLCSRHAPVSMAGRQPWGP